MACVGFIDGGGKTLEEIFDPRLNGFHIARLAFAFLVVVWHGISTGGFATPPVWLQFLSEFGVDCFFALSGFLVTRSWVTRRSSLRFIWARLLRIIPGLWVCLIAVAAGATLLAWLRGLDLARFISLTSPDGAVQYVWLNARIRVHLLDIADTPLDVPVSGVWNVSVWTLWWEVQCYAILFCLGVATLLLRGRALGWLVLIFWAVLTLLGITVSEHSELVANASRFGCIFLSGALMWLFRERIPVSGALVGIAAVCAVPFLVAGPGYQYSASLMIAYVVVCAPCYFASCKFIQSNDVSYGVYLYGYPVEQVLASWGIQGAGYVPYILASISGAVALGAVSWVLVERPALRLKGVSFGSARGLT